MGKLRQDAMRVGGLGGEIFTHVANAMEAKKERMLEDRGFSYGMKGATIDSLVSYGKGGGLSAYDVPVQFIKNIAYKFNQITDFKGDISDIKPFMSGLVGTGAQYVSKGFVKIVGKEAINKYVNWRNSFAHTKNQRDLIDFITIGLISEGVGLAGEIGFGMIPEITIPKSITAKGYDVVKQEIGYKFTDINDLNLTSAENLTHHFKKHQEKFPQAFIRTE